MINSDKGKTARAIAALGSVAEQQGDAWLDDLCTEAFWQCLTENPRQYKEYRKVERLLRRDAELEAQFKASK